MAVSYIEIERLDPRGEVVEVPEQGVLVFDSIVSGEGTNIGYDDGTGVITFHDAGYYFIDWYVAPQFGLTTNASNWAIQTTISQRTFIGSSHTKISTTVGFAIIDAAAGETVRLVNVSDGALSLSAAAESKAGLIAYSVATQLTS